MSALETSEQAGNPGPTVAAAFALLDPLLPKPPEKAMGAAIWDIHGRAADALLRRLADPDRAEKAEAAARALGAAIVGPASDALLRDDFSAQHETLVRIANAITGTVFDPAVTAADKEKRRNASAAWLAWLKKAGR